MTELPEAYVTPGWEPATVVADAVEEVLVEDLLLVVEEVVIRLELVVDVLLVDVADDVLLATSRAPSIATVAAEGLSIEYLR